MQVLARMGRKKIIPFVYLFFFVQCWELTLCIVGQCSTTKLYHQPLKLIYDANEYTDYGEVP